MVELRLTGVRAHAACLAVLAWALPARADIAGFRLDDLGGRHTVIEDRLKFEPHVVNHDDCKRYRTEGGTLVGHWSLIRAVEPGAEYAVKLSKPGGFCATTDLATVNTECDRIVAAGPLPTPPEGMEFEVFLPDLTGDCAASTDAFTSLHFVLSEPAGTTIVIVAQSLRFEVDLVPPLPPVVGVPEPGEGSLTVTWSDDANAGEEELTYRVCWSPSKLGDGASLASANCSNPLVGHRLQIVGLDPVEMFVVVTAIDPHGNASPIVPAATATGTPLETPEPVPDSSAHAGSHGCSGARDGAMPSATAFLILAVLGGISSRRVRKAGRTPPTVASRV